jgi:hypothetical protein
MLMANGLVSTPITLITYNALAHTHAPSTIFNILPDTSGTLNKAQVQVRLSLNRKHQHSQQLQAIAKDACIHECPHGSLPSKSQNQFAQHDQHLKSNMSSNGQVKGAFNITNDRQMRQEIEIVRFYMDCLGFNDFSNFDGARYGFQGCPIIIIKLVAPINVDKLFAVQRFQFKRKFSRQGRSHIDVIQCKIKGILHLWSGRGSDENQTQDALDEGVRIIKTDDCDYRIPEETLVHFLSHYGTNMSEVMEDLFDDGLAASPMSRGLNRMVPTW